MKKKLMTERNISVVHFENNKIPVFKELKNREWITYGENNDYPEYLIKLLNRSAKHNAIITGKVHYIVGNGLQADTSGMTVQQQAIFENWFYNLNEDVECLVDKVATDIELFDGCYLEIIPNKLGTGISEINHIGFEKIRVNKTKDGFLYSEDWKAYRQSESETGLKTLQPYNPTTFSGLYRYKGYRPGNNIYPIPEYIGCIPYIEIDSEISNFHLNNIQNGFVGGTMISFNNGIPLPEEQKVIEGKVKGKFTGTDKAGQLVITFSDNKDSAPTVTPLLPNGFDKMFDTLNQTVMQEIFTGHKITSMGLFGIKEANGLGSKDELRNAFELFQNGYVNSKQKIIEKIFNDFAELSGFGRPLQILKTEPISDALPQSEILKVMTPNEIREKAGLPIAEETVQSDAQKVLDALNSLSPLVATKVLNEMTRDEIRSLANLNPSLEPPVSNEVAMHAHTHECFSVEPFKNVGRSKDDFKVVKRSEVATRNDVILNEILFHKEKFYDADVIHPKILNLITENPSITAEEIAKKLDITKEEATKEIKALVGNKHLVGTIGKTIEVTPTGQAIIESTPTIEQPLEILYSYEERTNLPPLQTESREFCSELMRLNKLYTRQEIELISSEEDRDVWATRGGWFHNTKFDQTTPYCRHIWFQNIVRKK